MRIALEFQARKARELHTPVGRLSVSPQSRSLFSALFDSSRVLGYAKIRTVLQSTNKAKNWWYDHTMEHSFAFPLYINSGQQRTLGTRLTDRARRICLK